ADPLGLAPVTGSVPTVVMTGLPLGGVYGPLIGLFGLALDNLFAAEVVLADGRVVIARDDIAWRWRKLWRRDHDVLPPARRAGCPLRDAYLSFCGGQGCSRALRRYGVLHV